LIKRTCLLSLLLVVTVAWSVAATEVTTIPASVAVSSAVGLAEAEIVGLVRALMVVAATAEVQSAEWSNMVELLATLSRNSPLSVAWFALPDGSYYTVDAGLAFGNLSDQGYFPRLMDGQVVVGDVVVSRSTGRKLTIIAVPVAVEGATIGAVGVSLSLGSLATQISRDLALPEGWAFYAIDTAGEIALCSDPSLLMESAAALAELPERSVHQVSELLGWSFGVGTTG
jgi:hypothetical protein